MSIYQNCMSANIGSGDLIFGFGVDTVYNQGAIVIYMSDEYREAGEASMALYFDTVEAFDKFLEGAHKARDVFDEWSRTSEDDQCYIFEKFDQLMINSNTRI